MADTYQELPRLGTEAMGPCVVCKKQLLETGLPLFFRVELKRCGLDAVEIRRHVGLAQSMAPGLDGLALAGVLGPKVEPVVVMDSYTVNVCHRCHSTTTLDAILMAAMVAEEEKAEKEKEDA